MSPLGLRNVTEGLLVDDTAALGRVKLASEMCEGWVVGTFFPFAYYERFAALFRNYQDAANDQLLVEIDRLDQILAAHRFRMTTLSGAAVHWIRDIQISGRDIYLRWRIDG